MPILIKNITARTLDYFNDDVTLIMSMEGLVGEEDYIKLNKFEALIQNFTKVVNDETFETPSNFGLVRNNNATFIELDISY